MSARHAVIDENTLQIEPIGDGTADLDVEIYAARERSQLLAQTFGVDVEISQPTLFDTTDLST